ncbi:MAG: hypothetical protein OSB70_03675 [Myxococcota bacterium]|nr:hypothetical protein [Myxococcota bacterium]
MIKALTKGRQRRLGGFLALMAGFALAGDALAQAAPRAELKVGQPPYYVGVPISLHLQVEGLEREPEPNCTGAEVPGGKLTLLSISPNVSTRVTITNGRTRRTDSVTFMCRFALTVLQPGNIRVGPFKASQGALEAESPVYAIPVQVLARDPRVMVRMILPQHAIFVGQQVPIGIEWWIAQGLQEKIQKYEIRSELFEPSNDFRFAPGPQPQRGEQTLSVLTREGELVLPATVEKRSHRGEEFLVIRSERSLTPLRAGTFKLGSATIYVDEVIRWQRDFFGGRRAAETRRLFSRDEEYRLVVQDAPRQNRPASYGGAIGRGFSFEVAADRSVVQRGDPIALTFTVRGEGSLANVSLPNLEGPQGLPKESFGLAEEAPSGKIVDGAKVFRIPVRILDEDIAEIPALPFSWFDPDLGEYQTSYSRPIALSVRPAQLISAADVVARVQGDEAAAPFESDAPGETQRPSSDSFSLSGADLAIEVEHSRLVARGQPGALSFAAVYALSIAAVLAALGYRRRQQRDPKIARLRSACRKQAQRIDAAAGLPQKQGLGEIASALRELRSLSPEATDGKWENLIAECDAVFYSPAAGPGSEAHGELARRASDLVAEFARHVSRSAK